MALVAGLLAIAAAALVLALVELAGNPEEVTQQPAGQTPAPTPTTAGVPTTTPTPDSITIPPATADETAGGGKPEIADWPEGKDAWTIVLESSATQQAAKDRANELATQGVAVGLLNSDGYSSLEPGRWVVFSGQYDSRRAADQALKDLSGQVTGGYVRHVVPSTTGGQAAPSATPSASASQTP